MARSQTTSTSTHKALLLLLKSWVTLGERSLALLIGVLLLSESVAATPQQFSPSFAPPEQNKVWQGKRKMAKDKLIFPFSLALFPSEEATRAAAERTFEEGQQLRKQGTVESLEQAIIKYEEALPLYRAVGDKQFEAVTLNNIGYIYSALGKKQKALDFYNQSLPLSQANGNKALQSITLNNIGYIYSALGEKQKALNFYKQSLPLKRVTGDKKGEAVTLNNIGAVYDDLGEKQKALDFYNQSLPLSRVTGDKTQESITLNNIGLVYDNLGEKQKALDFYNQSLPLSRVTGDKSLEAVTLNNIGRIYSVLGQKQKALDFYNQSLPLSQATGDKALQAITLNNIGRVYDAFGEKQKALNFYSQCLPLRQATGDKKGEAVTLNNIGAVYDDLGEKQKALNFYKQSLPLSRVTGDKTQESVTLSNIGVLYSVLGQKQKAREFYNQSLPLSRATEYKAQEALILYNIAYLDRSQGNLNLALTQIEAAINIIENLRTKITSQELRASYFATVQDYYQFKIDLLMQLHKTNPNKEFAAQALQTSERSRARSLLEILTEAQANIRQGADPKLLEQESSLLLKLDALEKRRIELVSRQYTDTQVQALEQERIELQQEYQQLQEQIRHTSPRYASLKYPEPLTLSEIQQQVLDDDTLLLEYNLGKDRSYLWAVTKTSFTSYELPKRTDIEKAAQNFYEQTGKQKAPEQRGLGAIPREDSLEVTTQLSQILLSPVAGQLAGKRLLIVSDGALQYLPFAALPTPDSLGKDKTPVPLIVNHEIVNSPSASTIAILRQDTNGRKLAPKKVAVIADPVFSKDDERLKTSVSAQPVNPNDLDSLALTRSAQEADVTFQRLPFTRKESDRILSLVPSTQSQSALDFAANRATATSPELSQYQIVHFATHGILNSQNPELSGVVLSLVDAKGTPQNGFLRLNDIFNLNLPAELVVLSACETGLGKEIKGEGLVGLTRGFMYAGSPRVLVSLWSVADEGTSELMSRFYKKMLQDNLKPAAALRSAQIEMLQDATWKSPYYWAAFTLQGE
jgi:CHAT domain-containing protein/tetratricopeptide (TPR) repeat protein